MKPKKKPNWYEERYKELRYAVQDAKETLMMKTENVIWKKGVIDLYPEGADKAVAQAECDNAKYQLICAIGNYDARKQEVEDFYKKHYEELSGYTNDFATSHFIIEVVYRNYFKK